MHLRPRATAACAALLLAAACAQPSPVGPALEAAAAPAPVEELAHHQDFLFVNPGFESGALTPWVVSTGLAPATVPVYPVLQESDLGVTAGGFNFTTVKTGATYSLIPNGLGAADRARYPRFGTRAAMVNEGGNNNNVNKITQSSVVTTADVDPLDGLVHVRFVVLPVLQNPGHTLRQQPYYYVSITNQTRGTTLASRFNFSNEAGVPWLSTADGTVVYTDWLLFDLPLARSAVSLGDTLVATVIAGGCGLGGHWGQAVVDSFGATIPGLAVYASGPDSVEAGSDFQYTYRVVNGGGATATGVQLTSNLPTGTTFRSLDTPGVACTTPATGTRGTVSCGLGSLAVGALKTVTVTVRADATAPSPIRHGWYSVQSTEEQALTGPVVVTQVTTGGTARYVDLVTTLDDGHAGLTWGASTVYALTVTNTGPTTATGARVTTSAPAQLTGLAWDCTARLGASCGAATGTGALDTTATLPPGGSVVYAIRASVIAGTGAGQVSFTASAQAPAGTVERYALDNGAGDDDSLQAGLATVTLTRAGAGAGTLVSSPAGVTCGPGCTSTTGSFAAGSPVTLQAVPAAGSVFAGWSGGTCAGPGPCTFTPAGGEQVTGTFSPQPVRITSALAVTGAVGRPFSYTATAVGTAPVTLGATGLPAWLAFDPLTGRLTGTPPAAGTFTLTLSATDLNASDARTLTITVGVAPVITSALTWTRAAAGTAWTGIAVAASGDPTISYVASGFPPGGTLVFNSTTGAFGGAAGATGVFSIPVVATNAYGSDAQVLVVSVGGAPVITSPLTSAGTAAVPWSYTFTATGSGTVTRSVSGLPAWATFNPATGVLSGTPPAAGQFPIVLTASNAVGSSVQTLVLTVDGPPVITSVLAASGTAGTPWSYALTAVGTQPLTRAITGLPAWASYDPASGLLSGTPPAAGTVTFALSASNALGTDSRSLVLTVTAPPPPPAPPAITSPLADTAVVGVPYSYTLVAGGLQPMTLTATGLPAWASFDPATGVLSGTPTATGTVNVTLRAQNGLGSDTRTLVLTVVARPAITNALTAFGVVGQPFGFPLTATGTAPLTVGATGLPAGLALVGGSLTGTPAAAGVTAVQETAGNPYGTATATLTVTIRAALPAPVILLPAEGGVVGTATPALSGTAPAAEAGNSVRLTEGATVLCTATVGAGGTWSCTPAAALASGPHTVIAVLVDSHGPVGTATDTQAFTVDVTPPLAPTWSGPAAGAHLATATPELSGQAEAGATVTVTRGGQAVCAAVADGAGAWRCTPSAPLPQGPVVLTLVATDAAGNASPGVDRAVTVDTQAPAAPTLEGPPDQAVVASARPALSGHAEAGATVTVTVDGQPACTAVADPGGAWSCTPASDLADGPHQARAVAADLAGNLGPAASGTFTVDTHAPGAPAVSTVPLDGGAVGGRSPVPGGTAEPGATVTVTLDGAQVCTAVADAAGAWTCPAVGPLADGEHRLSATATDRAGNVSPATAGTFTVRPTAGALQPPAPASTTQNPRLEGTGTPGATIRVYVDGHQVGTTTVGPDGTWTFTLPPQTAGEHTVSIGVVGADGAEIHGPDQLLSITRPSVDVGGGIGCSQAGQGPSGLAALALLALAARGRRRRARAGGAAAALGALALLLLQPAPARAQAVVDGFELEQLALNPAARGGLVVGGGDVLPAGRFRVYAALGYENSPLKYFEDGVLRGTLVEHRWQLAVGGALSVLPWLEVGATVPVVLYQSGASLRSAHGDLLVSPVARGAQLGTPFLQARATPWREAAGAPLDLGLWLMMGLPLGSSAGLTRDPVMGQVGLGAGRTLGPVRLAAEVGVLLRPVVALLPGFGAGPGESVGSRLQAGLGLSTLGDGFRAELSARGFLPLTNQPASLELLAGVRVPIGLLELFALGGPGFGNAPGTPVFRLALGVSFGAAAWTPAPPDADGDGVPDASDACPAEAGPVDRQGCPLRDADGDGVPDEADACPAQPGPASAQGCPPPPEAPAPPAPAPTPAPAPAPPPPPAPPRVVVAAGRLELQGRVYFDTGRATLQPRSFPLLDEVARVLLAHPEVERVAIDGHTDDQGVPAANQRLSAARAAAVKTYLVAAGVPAGRLQARGFGQARPLTSNATPEGREQNRRVEFIILGP